MIDSVTAFRTEFSEVLVATFSHSLPLFKFAFKLNVFGGDYCGNAKRCCRELLTLSAMASHYHLRWLM
jgi:hypothetical protein